MKGRAPAAVCAGIAAALALAQLAQPGLALYHGWQYALALALVLAVTLTYVVPAARGADGRLGRPLALALAGLALVGAGGLASGLLGPDTTTIAGTPGTVVPIPALGLAAFFPPASAADVAGGGAPVVLRRRGAPDRVVSGGRTAGLGESVVFLEKQPAALIEAFDARGGRLTVTQPAATSFLSPVLLFRERQRIGSIDVPLDTFAVPAVHRVVHALYFTPAELAAFGHAGLAATSPALVLSAADDRGRPLGIALAPSGRTVDVAGMRVRATVGSYPAIGVASAPSPWTLVPGALLFVAGVLWAGLLSRRPEPASVAAQSRTETSPDAATGGTASVPTT